MLRRFMNWLLHQLQKVLGAFGGRRSNSRSSTPAQSNPLEPSVSDRDRIGPPKPGSWLEPETRPEPKRSLRSEAATPAKPGISFDIQPTEDEAQDENLADLDPYTRLDAASFTVSDGLTTISSQSPQSSQAQPAEALSGDQLPSIQDLLPAVEQEIKDNANLSESPASKLNATEPDGAAIGAVPGEATPVETASSDAAFHEAALSETALSETAPSETASNESNATNSKVDSEAVLEPSGFDEPAQALLFSFDITENPSADETAKSTPDTPASPDSSASVAEAADELDAVEPQSLVSIEDTDDTSLIEFTDTTFAEPAVAEADRDTAPQLVDLSPSSIDSLEARSQGHSSGVLQDHPSEISPSDSEVSSDESDSETLLADGPADSVDTDDISSPDSLEDNPAAASLHLTEPLEPSEEGTAASTSQQSPPDSSPSISTEFDRASLPYPWSIATPPDNLPPNNSEAAQSAASLDSASESLDSTETEAEETPQRETEVASESLSLQETADGSTATSPISKTDYPLRMALLSFYLL